MKSNIGPGGWIAIVVVLGVAAVSVAVFGVAALILTADYAESAPLGQQSCYVIMYTVAQSGDTWQSIANHWGMSASTLKAMNPTIKVPYWRSIPVGTSIKLAVWAGC